MVDLNTMSSRRLKECPRRQATVAQQEGKEILRRSPNVDVVVGTQALQQLPMLVEQSLKNEQPQVDINPYEDVSFPLGVARRNDPVKAYVNIVEGCNDFCAFCVVPYTRGHERMRSSVEILGKLMKLYRTAGGKFTCWVKSLIIIRRQTIADATSLNC